ncbi:HK97 gp10 family phage protein [Clostridium perfringens]|uniref:HK97-gp10 family putative phage morphogenesis protein n=1 Tax=Clostridium perfringens TaxID=1502 RepID=UPI000D70C429|nr:HK97-gp10 family putative phage morphogenesis protein [Clostridium perfringens]EGT3600651.1 HK97 gp10 family phage protein [Clostridium perfringens]MBO3322902.1 HK97 gp10 family phage protein [Clostridium perfringens]MBO3332066.1 HK97 gp10 family phage protein [Clostridium perfringens]PWW97914.1 hypothetical protein CYK75_14535 [Clostridium perfringens]UBK99692.1 HK97 gp10 family phage protein [Clostridium perfringens]
MSNGWEIEFEGLDELIKTFDKLATEDENEAVQKKILKECGDLAKRAVIPLIHRSKDNSKSGRKGSRPPGHAADNIPDPKIKKKKDGLQCIVGWEKTDVSPFFYMKMEEWGSSKRPPHHAFGKVNKILKNQYDKIAFKKYDELVRKKLGD